MALKIQSQDRININKAESLKEISAERQCTLTILIPESIRDAFKIKVIQNKSNITNVLMDFIKDYVK